MAKNTQPVLKRCRTLGVSPAAMGYAKPRRNLALLQKPWSVACASPIKKSHLAFLQKPTKLAIKILLVLTLPEMSTTTLQKIFDL